MLFTILINIYNISDLRSPNDEEASNENQLCAVRSSQDPAYFLLEKKIK